MGVMSQLKKRAMQLGNQAVGKLLEDPKRVERFAAAAGAVQRGKKQLDRAQGQMLHAMGFAHAGDYKDLGRQLSVVRRKAKHLLEQLEQLSAERT